jgi:K+ transporter
VNTTVSTDSVPRPALGALVAVLGVVYGDIGTSPLYAFRESVSGEHGVGVAPDAVLGVLSMIFWAVAIVIGVKYLLLVLRADNDGEGGMLALVLRQLPVAGRWRRPAIAAGLIGATLFYGDAVITPAISVLSAVEGLQVVSPEFERWVVPTALAILVALFAVQRFGAARVGSVFGPVMLLWFGTLAVLGAVQIAAAPGVLHALAPEYALNYAYEHPLPTFVVLSAVFLALTGGEALYADLGHFGAVNWLLLATVAGVVVGFGSSSELAAAYGLAVAGTMVVTTLGTMVVARHKWDWPRGVVLAVFVPLLALDVVFLAANSLKIVHGGWFPLVFGVVLYAVLSTWHRGRALLREQQHKRGLALEPFLKSLSTYPPTRVEGTAVFMSAELDLVPSALLHNLKHNRVLHERVVFLSAQAESVPHVPAAEAALVRDLGDGCWHVRVALGFLDPFDVDYIAQLLARHHDFDLTPASTSFFLPRQTVLAGARGGMARWRKHLFARMMRSAQPVSEFFRIPPNRVIEIGTQVVI